MPDLYGVSISPQLIRSIFKEFDPFVKFKSNLIYSKLNINLLTLITKYVFIMLLLRSFTDQTFKYEITYIIVE